MAVFSTNQVRQLYVVKNGVTNIKTPGYFKVGEVGPQGKKDHVYIQSTNALGEITRSDLIKKDHILWTTLVTPDQSRTPIKSVKVTLNEDYLVDGKPIAGQDYILNIYFRQYIGMSDTDIYIKQGFVRANSNMDKAEFYTQLACSLFRNFMREPYPLVKFIIAGKEVAAVKNNKDTGKPEAYEKLEDGTLKLIGGDIDGVTITEVEQEWRLGVKSQVPVYFDVYSTNIIVDGDEVLWATITDKTPKAGDTLSPENSYGNGKTIADLEYFCHGERGDMYRQIGWPNNLETQLMVDSTQNYYVLTIHYAFTDSNESVQKSEKDIVVVSTEQAPLDEIVNKLNSDI